MQCLYAEKSTILGPIDSVELHLYYSDFVYWLLFIALIVSVLCVKITSDTGNTYSISILTYVSHNTHTEQTRLRPAPFFL